MRLDYYSYYFANFLKKVIFIPLYTQQIFIEKQLLALLFSGTRDGARHDGVDELPAPWTTVRIDRWVPSIK